MVLLTQNIFINTTSVCKLTCNCRDPHRGVQKVTFYIKIRISACEIVNKVMASKGTVSSKLIWRLFCPYRGN